MHAKNKEFVKKLRAGQFLRNNSEDGKRISRENAIRIGLGAKCGKGGRSYHQPTNHKVWFVRKSGKEDVYDLSVPFTENFALANGVFVHNSKDLSDTVAAAVYQCYLKKPKDMRPRSI